MFHKDRNIRKLYRGAAGNQGSTLVMVLIAMTFVGLLGVMMLTVTLLNYQMKNVDAKAKENFYTAETAVDEIRTGLEEYAQKALSDAYETMLITYTTTADAQREAKFRENFVTSLLGMLCNPGNVEINRSVLEDMLIHSEGETAQILNLPVPLGNKEQGYVLLQGLEISFTDELNFQSIIKTDLKISSTSPKILGRIENPRGIFYADYAIIADQLFKNDELTSTNQTVVGNVYAGEGIVVSGTNETMTITANQVITREAIRVNDKAFLSIMGQSGSLSEVWAKNITTTCTLGSQTEASDYLKIHANSYIKDDLTLNAAFGNVTMTGAYYGYNYVNGGIGISGSPEDNSSITMNANNATLHMSGLDTLLVAGKSYLSVPSIYGTRFQNGFYVMQGESVSYKGTQTAYLLPGYCVKKIGHNPMTIAEYAEFDGVDITRSQTNGGLKLEDYVNITDPYYPVYVNFQTGSQVYQMVYLYLNFKNQDRASAYFNDYADKYQERIEMQNASIGIGGILLPEEGRILSTGTLMNYNTEEDTETKVIDNQGLSYRDTLLTEYKDQFTTQFMNLTHILTKEGGTYMSSSSLTDNLINYEQLIADDTVYQNTNPNEYIYCGNNAGSTLRLGSGSYQGVIIATGDVVISGADFHGLIITKGNVILEGAASIQASEGTEELIKNNETIRKYFRDYQSESQPIEDEVTLNRADVTITVENWMKN